MYKYTSNRFKTRAEQEVKKAEHMAKIGELSGYACALIQLLLTKGPNSWLLWPGIACLWDHWDCSGTELMQQLQMTQTYIHAMEGMYIVPRDHFIWVADVQDNPWSPSSLPPLQQKPGWALSPCSSSLTFNIFWAFVCVFVLCPSCSGS